MKKSLFALAAVASLGLFLAGCGEDSDPCDDLSCTDAQTCRTYYDSLNILRGACAVSDEVCSKQGLVVKEDTTKAGADRWTCAAGESTAKCTKDADCSVDGSMKCDIDGDHGALNTCYTPSAIEQATEYKYVKIQDETPEVKTGYDPGADIDAVVLTKSAANGGGEYYAADVVQYWRGGGQVCKGKDQSKCKEPGHAYDPDKIIGAPDAVVDYANPDREGICHYLDTANTDYTNEETGKVFLFVSLGGKGNVDGKSTGFIIVQMQKKIENGDNLSVMELGGCKIKKEDTFDKNKDINNAEAEKISVSVAISDDAADGEWIEVIKSSSATKGVVSATVANIPE